jgi:hypothetical protein
MPSGKYVDALPSRYEGGYSPHDEGWMQGISVSMALYQHLNHEPQTWPQVLEEKDMTTSGFVLIDTW